jgi:hypothetical protein
MKGTNLNKSRWLIEKMSTIKGYLHNRGYPYLLLEILDK